MLDSVPVAPFDVQELRPPVRLDNRGQLVKVFDAALLGEVAPDFAVAEIFWTRSAYGVVRGLHFQTPAAQVEKIVFCTSGAAFDVIVDLRRDVDTYGSWQHFVLRPDSGNVVHVPIGFAHGFCALESDTVVCYAQSGAFDPQHDAGILWTSVGIEWPVEQDEVIVSPRDAAFPDFSTYRSPF